MKKILFLGFAFTVVSGITLGCSSADNYNNGIPSPETTNKSIQTETAKVLPDEEKQNDKLPEFKAEEDYKKSVREKMLKAGWKPARTKEGDENCNAGGRFCTDFPELESGPSAGQGHAIFRWERNGKALLISTVDDPPFYVRHEFEKTVKPSKTNNISGRYVYEYTEDYGGEISFDFKDKNAVEFGWMQEDMTWKGSGTWTWDEAKKILTATVSVEQVAEMPTEGETEPPRKEIYIFQKVGNNLKLTNPPADMDNYKGKIFQRK